MCQRIVPIMFFSWLARWTKDQLFVKQPRLRALITKLVYGSGVREITIFGTGLTIDTCLENGYLRAFRRTHSSSLWREESSTLCALFAILRPGDLFVDVGANIGLFACTLSRLPGVECLALEANPDTFQRLKINADRHGVEACHAALSDRDNVVLEFVSGAVSHVFAAASGRNRYHYGQGIQLSTRALDSLIKGTRPVVLKIDVEGHEPQVIQGARRLLEAGIIQAVLLDSSPETQLAAAQLVEHGFTLLNPTTFLPSSPEDAVILALSSARHELLTSRITFCRDAPAIRG